MGSEKGTIWALAEYKPLKAAWDERIRVLAKRRSYYDGTMYAKAKEWLGWLHPRVGKTIKPLFLPLSRAVDVDAGIIPGGWSFVGEGEEMGEPVTSWVEARDQVFAWSEWQTDGVLYVHYGAQYGVSGLKVSDLREEGKIIVKPIDPMNFMLVYGDDPSVPKQSIYVEERKGADGEVSEWAEVITAERIVTYLDGVPTQDWEDGDPGWPNEIGVVPYVEIRHIETGHVLGEATFQKAMPLLDEVNQLASDLASVIKDHGEPQWAVSGAEPSDLVHSGDNVWFLPEGAKVEILLPPVDIPGILDFIREIKEGVKEALPELSFDELRSKDQIAAETLGLQLIELVLKVQRTRPNYDNGLVKALQIAGLAAETMSLPDVAVLNDETLEMDEEREILPLDPRTRIDLEMAELALERERAMAEGGGMAFFGGGNDRFDEDEAEE